MTKLIVGRILCAAIAICFSGYLAVNNLDGWGWFLLAAIIIVPISAEDYGGG